MHDSVKLFLSYPVDERDVVERVHYALLAQGYDVFFDRADLAPGHEYDQAIARAIAASDVFVFFITPASIAPGRYTLTELRLAEQKWPHASGHVLPVMLRPSAFRGRWRVRARRTPRGVAAVLRRADGSADVAWIRRARQSANR